MTCIFYAACFGSVVMAVAAAVDSLCMSMCGCLHVLEVLFWLLLRLWTVSALTFTPTAPALAPA